MPLSLGLMPEFLRHAQRQQSRHADYPVVFSDPSDPEGLTYAQVVFSRDFGQWLVEYQKAASQSIIELHSPRVMVTMKTY